MKTVVLLTDRPEKLKGLMTHLNIVLTESGIHIFSKGIKISVFPVSGFEGVPLISGDTGSSESKKVFCQNNTMDRINGVFTP